jgi:dTDP-4-amino-4,6-dideoxygalactose transaminase
MIIMAFPVFKPFLGPEELAACADALNCKYLGMGSFVGEFERSLADMLELEEDRHVVTFSTGHAAMHLGLLAIGVGPGDEVITPSFNNIADFQAIEATGAQPVLCDVDEHSLCIDPARVSELITGKTKAIVAMDYGARMANHAAVSQVGSEAGIPVFHDAAHSFGSRYKGKPVGHHAKLTMLSFDPIKNITCIDGGALVIDDTALLEPLHEMRLIGMSQRIQSSYSNRRDWGYDVHRLGFRYHLANLHAAVGLSQMRKFVDIKRRRRTLYSIYFDRLNSLERCVTQGTLDKDIVPFIMCVRVPAKYREAFKANLLEYGIETGIHWKPGHMFSRYEFSRSGPLDVTNRIAGEIVSLPFYPDLTVQDVNFICDKVVDFFKNV